MLVWTGREREVEEAALKKQKERKKDVKAKSLQYTLPWLMAIALCHLAPYVHNKFKNSRAPSHSVKAVREKSNITHECDKY